MRVATPPGKPLLIFDGDCNFCRRWIARWQQATGDRVDYLPAQDPQIAQRFPEIPAFAFQDAVQLVEPDGTVTSGAEAVFRALDRPRVYRLMPGVFEWAYRFVARRRGVFSFLTRVLWGNTVTRPSHSLVRGIFVRGFGLIYLFAFVSLWTQITGLIGSHGIQPVAELLKFHADRTPHWLMPTVFWWNGSDAALHWVCGAGTLCALLVIAGVLAGPALLGAWALYLSLSVVGDIFLGYQWDALLLEVGFLAIWFAPWGWSPRAFRQSEPPRLVLWALRWLVFRLMFLAGVVKLASHDQLWRSLTALTVHYQTQPLPPWTAWYAHQLPVWWQMACCGVMFVIELVLPFFVFLPRRVRFVAAGGFTLLMILVSGTGNYCFFNLLTILLCVPLLDDAALRWRGGPRSVVAADATERVPPPTRWRNWLFAPVVVVILLITGPQLLQTCRARIYWPEWFGRLYGNVATVIQPARSLNGYGLFAAMTDKRFEIVVEGSDDGQTWRAYEFKYKPGDPARRPGFVWPHQPRLDWQMWFEALHLYQPRFEPSPWFLNFCVRLLQNEPTVTRLLAHNPFPAQPPRYIRAVAYEYRFTDPATRAQTGQWWRRELLGQYCPALSLRS